MRLVENGELLDQLYKGQIFKDSCCVSVNLNNCLIGPYLILLSINHSGITDSGSRRVPVHFNIAISVEFLDLY